MIFKVYGNHVKPEILTFLKLEETPTGIMVVAVNDLGRMEGTRNLLRFNNDGGIDMQLGVEKSLGFRLGDYGVIKINSD